MAANPQIAFTNMETSARTGVFRCLVPWSTGDIPNLAFLQTSRQIEFNGSNVNTHWSTFGPDHRDGSVRWSVAEFEATIPAGSAAPTAPTVTATVVNAANTQPTPDFTEFDALWANTDVDVSYTDSRNGTTYTLSLLTVARAGTNNATYTETSIGMRKIIRAEAYMGRGRHYELTRASGYGTNSASTLTTGNLHVRLWFEVTSGNRWGHGVIQFSADSQYPYPSQPPDDGTSRGNPSRPTQLDPASGEELEEPLTFEFSALSVNFTNSASTSTDTQSAAWWYTPNAQSGSSCYGANPTTTTGRAFNLGLGALGDQQGWPLRFTLAWNSAETLTTLQVARERALRPYTFIGMPTHDTWMDTTRSGALPSPYDGDTLAIKGGLEMPLQPVPQAELDNWYQAGPARYSALIQQDYQSLGWGSNSTITRDWEWNLLGRRRNSAGTGSAPHFGMFQEGRIWLANSVWDLYLQSAYTAREMGGCRYGMAWKQEDQPVLGRDAGIVANNSCWWTGTELHKTTNDCKGRYRSPNSGDRPVSGSHYQGAVAEYENPSWNGLSVDQTNTGTWLRWDHAHFGMRQSFQHFLLTQDYFLLDMMTHHAVLNEHRQCDRYYFGANPADAQTRAEARTHRSFLQMWLMTGDSRWPNALTRRVDDYVNGNAGGVGSSTANRRWQPFPVMAQNDTEAYVYPCDNTPRSNRVRKSPVFMNWQAAHTAVFYLAAALEWSDDYPDECLIMTNIVRMIIRTIVENCCMAAPGELTGPATTIDGCWNHVLLVRAANTGEIAALTNARYGIGKFFYVDPTGATAYSLQSNITTETDNLNPSNDGQNQDHYPAILAYEIFADYRADADFVERAEFFIRRLQSWLVIPQTSNSYLSWAGHDSGKGYASDRWLPSGTFAPPTPVFTASARGGLSPLSVSFDATASQINGDRSAATLRWWYEWDGSSTSPDLEGTIASNPTIETPSHTYTTGSYRVKLEIVDSAGQSNDLDISDYIIVEAVAGAAPVVDFDSDVTSGVIPLEVQFFDRSTGSPYAWEWTVTDSAGVTQTSAYQDPTFTFLNAGTVDVTLRASNVWGTSSAVKSAYITVTSPSLPTAKFSITPGFGSTPPDFTVTLTNTSTNATTYSWNFGDGTTSTSENPGTHTYTTDGTYRISLIAYNDIGDWDSYVYPLTVARVSGEATVPVELEITPDVLIALTRIYDVTVTAGDDGNDVQVSYLEATALASDGADSFAEASVNPGASVAVDYPEATATTYDVVLEFDRTVAVDYVAPTAATFNVTPLVNVLVTEPDLGQAPIVTASAYDVSVIAGTGKTVAVSALFVTPRAYDLDFAGVVYDVEVEADYAAAQALSWDLVTGRQSIDVLVDYPSVTTTTFDVSAVAHGIGVDVLLGTAYAYTATAEGTEVPELDSVELYGSLEAPPELVGTV